MFNQIFCWWAGLCSLPVAWPEAKLWWHIFIIMNIMVTSSKGPMHALLHSVPPTPQQATTDPCLRWRLLDTHKQIWVSPLWGHCSFLLGPGAQGPVCPLQESISQSCVSSGSSMVGLMVISAVGLCHTHICSTQSPVPVAVYCWPIPPQKTLKHRGVSSGYTVLERRVAERRYCTSKVTSGSCTSLDWP